MVGSSTWVTRLATLPKRAMTFEASVRGMWMIWLTSRLNVKPSCERTVMVLSFSSSLCDSLLPVAQLRTTLAVGTGSTLWVNGLIGYLPGSRGSTQTPFSPRETRLPCLKESPVTSLPAAPTKAMTTPAWAMGTCVIGAASTVAKRGLM